MRSLFSRLFIPQATLDRWSSDDTIALEGDDIVLEGSGWRYRLAPAIHIETCASGDDSRELVGTVRLEAGLKEDGAEVYSGSVLIGEDAYEGVAGFLAVRRGATSGDPENQSPDQHEVEILNKFLLEKL